MQTVYAVMLPTSLVLHLPLAHVSFSTLRKSDSMRRPLLTYLLQGAESFLRS